jgi:DNA-binding IclR family transcriptional regulator
MLLAFSEHRHEATVAELAQIAGCPMPTAYRYVALLKELELLRQGPTGTYHPTARVMPIARAAQLANGVARISRPVVTDTAARLRETVMLLQHLGDSVICIEMAECDRAMRFTFQRGHSMPLGIGASGKMALACLPADIQAANVPRLTGDHALQRELDQAKARQYATSEAEVDEGVWACSVPVLISGGGPFVLSVAGPAARIDDAAKAVALEVLRDSARRIREGYEKYAL